MLKMILKVYVGLPQSVVHISFCVASCVNSEVLEWTHCRLIFRTFLKNMSINKLLFEAVLKQEKIKESCCSYSVLNHSLITLCEFSGYSSF